MHRGQECRRALIPKFRKTERRNSFQSICKKLKYLTTAKRRLGSIEAKEAEK